MDRILAIVALATFIAYLVVIPLFVPDIDLIIVVSIVAIMAIYDLWPRRDKT
jgi:hypothetical protein